MRRLKFPIPISILLFIGLTLAGTYFARRQILEQHLRTVFKMHNRDDNEVIALLKSWPSPVNARLDKDYTLLHWAVWEGKPEVVRLCVERGARINALGAPLPGCPWRQTPLHMAVYRRRADIVELLIAAGADVNGKDKSGRTPLSMAVTMGRRELADLLRAHGAKEEPAAARRNAE